MMPAHHIGYKPIVTAIPCDVNTRERLNRVNDSLVVCFAFSRSENEL